MCAFQSVRGEYVVTIDDDLQNPPEEIPSLLRAALDTDADLVYGVPRQKQHGPLRNFGSRCISSFYRLVFQVDATVTSFRIIRRPIVDAIANNTRSFVFIDGLLAWHTSRIRTVQVEHFSRYDGESGYSLRRLVQLSLNMLTNFSLLPLQLATITGLIASLGGLSAAGYYLCRALFSEIEVPGYASQIVSILVLGGLQLFALGVIGEYLGRVHLNINGKPQYLVRSSKGPSLQDHNGCS